MKTACEAEKVTLQGLHRTGNLARIDGGVSGTGALKLCFHDVRLTEAMDKLAFTLEASGSADLDTHFKFVPLDVVGHILCPLEWTAAKRINTTVPPQSTSANIDLTRTVDAGTLTYEGRFSGFPVRLHFQPSPLSLVLQNINFPLACPPAAALINGLTLNLAPLIPDVLKDYTYTLEPLAFSFTPDLPMQPLFQHTIKPTLSETSRALLVSGVLQ